MPRGPLTLQQFLGSLESRLDDMPAAELRARLVSHARTLAPDERAEFLAIFTGPRPKAKKADHDARVPVDDHPLLDEVDAFVDRVRSGKYFLGYGWDNEMHEERSFGDESWVVEMDGLFAEANDAFISGRLGLARSAYERLLQAFRLDEEVGSFSGPLPAVDMVRTDVPEVSARYLRAVYETTPPGERASELATLWFGLPGLDPPSLRLVREALPADLPDLATFLPAWVARLRSVASERPSARRLLTEAVEALEGVDGLGNLARELGPDQAQRHLDWVEALLRDGRRADAATAAREAIGTLAERGGPHARLAEHLADLADDDGARLEARRVAWRSAPSRDRLVALVETARLVGRAPEVLSAEMTAVQGGETPSEDDRLVVSLLLLAGRVAEAQGLVDRGDPASRWGSSARQVVLAYLLAAGCGGPMRPEWGRSAVAALLADVDRAGDSAWSIRERGAARQAPEGRALGAAGGPDRGGSRGCGRAAQVSGDRSANRRRRRRRHRRAQGPRTVRGGGAARRRPRRGAEPRGRPSGRYERSRDDSGLLPSARGVPGGPSAGVEGSPARQCPAGPQAAVTGTPPDTAAIARLTADAWLPRR